jgi:hypothetical protein
VTEEIVLTLPRERRFYDVAHLVVGGLAVRLNLTVENLSDLQLAIAGLLPRAEAGGDVTVTLRLGGDSLEGRIGPFDATALKRDLAQEGTAGIGTHHVLDAVFERYGLDVEGDSAWVDFTMGVSPAPREA